jgi:TRAP-type C4-dicarboxylate transport system permease large subunit
VLAREQAPQALASAMLSITENASLFLLLVNVLLLLIGMILEPTAALLIMVPVLLPTIEVFGIDPLHFGIIMILNLMIGLLTPPVGLVLYVLTSVTDVSFQRVVQGTAPFLIPLVLALLLVTYIPSVSLYLPRLLGLV